MFQKKGVGTKRLTATLSNLTRLYYNGSAAKSHSTTTQYRQLRRLPFTIPIGLRCDIHNFTSFCNYSVLPSLSKVYHYYYYYYHYYYYYYYYYQEKYFSAILRKSPKFIYGTVLFSIILFAL